MDNGLESIIGVIPVVMVAGVATKVTEKMFETPQSSSIKKINRKNKKYVAKARKMLNI